MAFFILRNCRLHQRKGEHDRNNAGHTGNSQAMGRKHHDHRGKHTTDQAAHNAGAKAGLDVAVPNAIAQAFFQRVKARGHKHDPFSCHLADVRLHHKLECHNDKQDRKKEEIRYLYRIANVLPQFLEERGFTAEPTGGVKRSNSLLLDDAVRPYYRDYIDGESTNSYRSLHITFFDNSARCYMEMQLRTKEMDDIAEIGVANHLFYEKKQETSRGRRDAILQGGCIYFDEAYERCRLLQNLDLSGVDVNMFTAVNNSLMNDGCGLFRGRLILPYEHLSKFQNDMID